MKTHTLFLALFLSSLTLTANAQTAKRKHASTSKVTVASAPLSRLTLEPQNAILDGSYSFQTLAAVGIATDRSERDLSETATFTSSNPGVVKVGKDGVAYPVGDGTAEVTATAGGHSAKAKFSVKNTRTDARISFENAITPILVKNGCTGSACHGAPTGQGGLKLSFFGYEAKKDWETIVNGASGHRVNKKEPSLSLIIKKPTGEIPHGGGRRFKPDGPEVKLFTAWVKAGANYTPAPASTSQNESNNIIRLAHYEPVVSAPKLDSLAVTPGLRLIREPNSRHQLIVMAKYTDGSERDVTPFARFACDDDGIAIVDSVGKLTALRKGEANVMVRYGGKVGLSQVMVQPQKPMANYPAIKANNFIDTHVLAKLKTLNLVPSDLADDATFLRRVYFDIAGTPPLPTMVRAFVENTDPQKRSRLIDELLERPEYKDYQTILWADLLRNTQTLLKEDGVKAYTRFIRESFAENKPFDRFVRDLLTAKGSTYKNESGAANYYRVTDDPAELTTSTSQIFMGVRLECCRCHNHPFDRWKQDDYWSFAAFFAKTHQTGGTGRDEIVVFTDENGQVKQLRTGQVMQPKFLTDEANLKNATGDVRVQLANWITAKENPFFAKATVNRVWKQFFGRGIVHPVDDFRATNPPINAPLLDALAEDFVSHGYDLKQLIRTICNSRIYQLSSKPNATNGDDNKNFSHYYIKRLGSQQLLDAVVVATEVPENFPGVRVGTTAINLSDNTVGSYFLDVFGRSRRLQVAEPSQETSMSQALALMNGPTLNNKIADTNGFLTRRILNRLGDRTPKALLDDLYLNSLARFPTETERKQATDYLKAAPSPKEGYEDLMWVLLNSKEFLFNH
ncbi:MAG: DUF1549 domain-containing protein [Chthonomonadaceae bacterium]|nr:DUF1549 domain-containing protein [Chthonomonadaceae bacterium]